MGASVFHNLSSNSPGRHDEPTCPLLLGYPGPGPAYQTPPGPHRHRVRGQNALLRPRAGLRQVLLVRQQVQPGAGLPQPPLLHRRGRQDHPEQRHPQAHRQEARHARTKRHGESHGGHDGRRVHGLQEWLVRLCYNPDFDNLKEAYIKGMTSKLERFSKFLASKSWFAGDSLTFVDFVMYELIDQHKLLVPDCLKPYTNLEAFMSKFEALPKVAEYMKSPRFMKTPINNKMAKFGF